MHAFITAYGVGESRVRELQQLALSGMGIKRAREPHLDPPKEGLRFSPAEIEAAVWQHSFINKYSDWMPNEEAAHLDPTVFSELGDHYTFHCKVLKREQHLVDEKCFNKVWKNRFLMKKQVSIRVSKGVKGGLCFHCGEIKLMGLQTQTREQLAEWKKAKVDHRNFHGKERQLSAARFLDADLNPIQVDTVAFDIWDVSKLKTPWTKFGHISRAVGDSNNNCIKNRVQGFLGAGPSPRLDLCKSYDNVQKGANLTVTQLMGFIHRRGTGLAPLVNFEIDGGSENQNRTVLAFYAHLVAKRSTEVVVAYRPPLMHTHNRLDRKFGTASQNTCGRSGGRARVGCGALSQQEWDRKVTASLSGSCDVNVSTVLRFLMCFLQQQHSYLIPLFLFILFLHR